MRNGTRAVNVKLLYLAEGFSILFFVYFLVIMCIFRCKYIEMQFKNTLGKSNFDWIIWCVCLFVYLHQLLCDLWYVYRLKVVFDCTALTLIEMYYEIDTWWNEYIGKSFTAGTLGLRCMHTGEFALRRRILMFIIDGRTGIKTEIRTEIALI